MLKIGIEGFADEKSQTTAQATSKENKQKLFHL